MLELLFNKIASLQDCSRAYVLHTHLRYYFSLSKTLKNIWLLISKGLHSFINTTCITPLFNMGMFKIKIIKNIFNLQEWHQNTQNSKSLFLQTFVYKTFTVGIKTKNLPRTTKFGLWSFYKGISYNNHFWVVPRVFILYKYDCIKKLKTQCNV